VSNILRATEFAEKHRSATINFDTVAWMMDGPAGKGTYIFFSGAPDLGSAFRVQETVEELEAQLSIGGPGRALPPRPEPKETGPKTMLTRPLLQNRSAKKQKLSPKKSKRGSGKKVVKT